MVSVDDKSALLVYRIGPVYCCSPTRNVETITIPTSLTHPPGTDAAHPGIFKHGGHIVSVSDLRYLFGVEQADWHQPGRMVITELADGHVGFWIDDIIDVITFPQQGWGNLPPHLPRGIFNRTLLHKNRIHLYAEFEKLNTLKTAGYLKQYIATLIEEQQDTSIQEKQKVSSNPVETKTTTQDNLTHSVTKKPEPPAKKKTYQETFADKPAKIKKVSTEPVRPQVNLTTQRPTHSDIQFNNDRVTASPITTSIKTEKHDAKSLRNPHIQEEATVTNNTYPQNSLDNTVSYVKQDHAITTKEKYEPEKPAHIQTSPEQSESSGIVVLLVFLLFIMAGGYAAYHFLIDMPENNKNLSTYKTIAPVDEPISIPEVDSIPDNQDNTELILDEQPVTDTPDLDEQTQPKVEDVQEVEIRDASSNISKDQLAYHASIEKNEDGITIILNAPDENSEIVEDKNIKPVIETENEIEPVEITQETTQLKTEVKQTVEPETKAAPVKNNKTKPKKVEIIHIVVKGDTLWHIARRYVENPFLYPELARLSNIKNPHRIYPGDKVRIIKYLN